MIKRRPEGEKNIILKETQTLSLNRPQDRVVGVGVAGSGFDSQVPALSSGWSAGGRSSVIHTKRGRR